MACNDGYYGRSCLPCPQGTFGTECGGRCYPKCAKEVCNHINGCLHYTETTTKNGNLVAPTRMKTNRGMNTRSTSSITLEKDNEFITKIDIKHKPVTSTHLKEIAVNSRVHLSQRLFTEKVSTSSGRKNVFNTEDPITEGDINKQYILAAAGIVIVMFFFVIMLQLYTYKRSKSSSKIKPLKQNRREEITTYDQSFNEVQRGNEQTASSESPLRSKNNFNLTVESDYHDIDELLELRRIPALSNEIEGYEKPHCLSNSKISYYPLTVCDKLRLQELKDQYLEPVSGHLDENAADLYLQPVNV